MIIRDPKVRDYPVNKILKREKLFKNLLLKSFCSYRWFSITIRKKIVKIFSRCRYYSIPNSHSFYRNNLFIDRFLKWIVRILERFSRKVQQSFPKIQLSTPTRSFHRTRNAKFFFPAQIHVSKAVFSAVDAHRNDRKFQRTDWWVAITNAFDATRKESMVC